MELLKWYEIRNSLNYKSKSGRAKTSKVYKNKERSAMLKERKLLVRRGFVMYVVGLFYLLLMGDSTEAKALIPGLSIKSIKKSALSQKIDLREYAFNEGTDYEKSFQEAQEFIPLHELVIWQDDFKDPSQSGFISVTKMKDFDGNPVNLEQSLQIFGIDFDGDLQEEILLVPRIISGNYYRATILKKFFDYYQPIAISEITGDFCYVVDIRDLNQDQHPDLILGCSSGASSYQDIREVFWFSGDRLQTQVFNQWVRLRDFNQDGIFELLVDSVGGTSGSHAQWAYWTDIYVWNGQRYEKDNARYPEYYKEELIPGYLSEILSYSESSTENMMVILDRVILIQQAENIIQSGQTEINSSPLYPIRARLPNQQRQEL